MNHIVEQTFQETIDYVKGLNLKRHFSNLLERYLGYYKKGMYVHFSFGSSSTKACFGHYVTRHGLDSSLLEGAPDKEKRNTRMQVYHVRDKITSKNRSLHNELDKWRKELRDLEKSVEDRSMTPADGQFHRVKKALIAMHEHYQKESKEKVKRTETELKVLTGMGNRYKKISSEFQHAETEILKLALDFFMKSLEEKVSQFFGGYKVKLTYSRKEIIKRYAEKKGSHSHSISLYRDSNRELTVFERELFGFLESAKNAFVINIYRENDVYKLTASEHKNLFTLSIEQKGDEYYDPFNKDIFLPLSKFLDKYEGFDLLLRSFRNIKDKFGDEAPAIQIILQMINLTYPRSVIEEYNTLQRELAKNQEEEKEKSPKWISNEEAIQKMVESFAEFQFNYGTKDDENMNFIMSRFGSGKEKYLIHFIDEITNGVDVLKLTA